MLIRDFVRENMVFHHIRYSLVTTGSEPVGMSVNRNEKLSPMKGEEMTEPMSLYYDYWQMLSIVFFFLFELKVLRFCSNNYRPMA